MVAQTLVCERPAEEPAESQAKACATQLEKQFQRELDLPRREGRTDGSKGGAGRLCVRYPKIRVVQHVEELGPELHAGFFADPEALVNGTVPLVEVGSPE